MSSPRFGRLFFLFFLLSGFCSLLYELVWTRLAMAAFGVTTTVISIVLSVFMAGLAVGSWAVGVPRLLRWLGTGRRFLRAYALVEIAIGTGAFAVPSLFDIGRALLLSLGQADSVRYHLLSGLVVSAALLPWTALMGATFALALGALRTVAPPDAGARASGQRAFSYLYLANILGAACGVILTAAALVELFGFRGTLRFGALGNAVIGGLAWWLAGHRDFDAPVPSSGGRAPATEAAEASSATSAVPAAARTPLGGSAATLLILFASGFVSMAMEVVWTRMFARYLGTFVYAFAALLAIYLLATYAGTYLYRRRAAARGAGAAGPSAGAQYIWAVLGLLGVLPLIYADGRFVPHHGEWLESPWLVLAVAPICAALGYVTPLLVDRYGALHVGRASRAYSVNVVGCILGPLCAGYVLLPWLGERGALLALTVVPLAIGLAAVLASWRQRAPARAGVTAAFAAGVVATVALGSSMRTYAETIPGRVVKRDHTATVVAHGQDMDRRLLVNGVGITNLTTITKTMAHFPLAHLPVASSSAAPRAALVICFGMGTTFRSLASWGIEATGVELVPSVPALFSYFHADAPEVLRTPGARIIIDDGRRFLDRTLQQFDLVTVDPPPPVQAAGSSLLYSREFYQAVKRRLRPGGLVAQWLPSNEPTLVSPVARAILAEFPHVRAFTSMHGWGVHFLASMTPLPRLSAVELGARLPAAARADLLEWTPRDSAHDIFATMIAGEYRAPADELTRTPVEIPTLTDDHPSNEYFALRRLRHGVP